MKKILLLLLISISGYSQTLLKLKAIEYAPGAGYCIITNSLGVQTYTPCSSLTSTVIPTLQQVVTSNPTVDGTLAQSLDAGANIGINNGLVQLNSNTSNLSVSDNSIDFTSANVTAPTPTISSNTTDIATTAWTRSVTAYVTPEMFGAVGDGTTNDYTALQSAFDSGKEVFLSQKNYRTVTTLTVSSNAKILGSGYLSILSTTANITILQVKGSNNTIDNISFVGSGSGSTQIGLMADGVATFTLNYLSNIVTNCNFLNLAGSGIYARNIIGSSSGTKHEGAFNVSNCIFNGCNFAINCQTRGEYNVFTNCSVASCTTGVNFVSGNNSFIGGQVTDCITGLSILSGTNDSHCGITGTKVNHNTTNISSTHQRNYTFTGCQFYVGNISLTGTGKNKFVGCDFYMLSNTLTITNSPAFFYSSEFETTPTTYSLTGTAPVMVGTYSGTLLLTSPTATTSNVVLQSGNNLSDVTNTTTSLNNLLPSQTSNSGKYLTTNGTNASWGTITGGGDLLAANNLSDVSNTVTARNNILPTKTGNSLKVLRVNAGETDYELATATGTGDLLSTNNLSDVASKFTSRNNLGEYEMFITGGDATTTSTVASSVPSMSFTATANKRYYIEGIFHVGVNNTGGIKLQVTLPSGATVFIECMGASSSATAYTRAALTSSGSLTSVNFWTVNSSSGCIKVAGEVSISSTSGTVSFDWAVGTNGQTGTMYQLGTCLKYRLLN